jgi:gluconolactonase
MQIDVRDPRFYTIIDVTSGLEKIATGFDFLEGPIWHPTDKSVIFSDILGNSIYSWTARNGVQKRNRHSYMANGNAYDHKGRLITCEHATSRLTRTDLTNNTYETLASHYNGKQLNSPNDVVVKRDGAIYFTDPTSGRSAGYGVPREPELSFSGVYRLDPATGDLTMLVDDFAKPNGLCFSRDERQLYVNDTKRFHIRVFDVLDDGTLQNGRIWAETTGDGTGVSDGTGVPDGMKIDIDDNIYCCGPGGIHVFDAHGVCLGVVLMPEHATNFVFGGDDFQSLYITASTSLYRLCTQIPGHPTFRPIPENE